MVCRLLNIRDVLSTQQSFSRGFRQFLTLICAYAYILRLTSPNSKNSAHIILACKLRLCVSVFNCRHGCFRSKALIKPGILRSHFVLSERCCNVRPVDDCIEAQRMVRLSARQPYAVRRK